MKRNFKRFLTAGIAACMVLQLAACGDGKKDSETNTKTLAEQKEFVYVPEYQPLDDIDWMSETCVTDSGLYFTTSTYDEEAMTSHTKLCFIDASTKEIQEIPLELGENEENVSVYVQNMCVLGDGNIALVKSVYIIEDPETWEGTQNYILEVVSASDGSVLNETDITDMLNENEYPYIQYMAADGSDNVYLTNGESKVWVYDREGKKLFDMDLTGDSWVQAFGTSKEGQVVYLTWAQDGIQLSVIDPATRGVSKTCKENVPETYGNASIVPGRESGILLGGESSLIEYDLEKETATKVMDWLDSDINRSYVEAYGFLKDGRIVVASNDWSSDMSRYEVAYLTETPSSEIPQKEILTIGVMYASSDVSSAIINFNKTSDKYRIQLVNYGEGDGEDAYEAGLIKFNSDLASGNGPDIFDLSSVNMKMLSQKGVIEDLNPYLEKDPELNKEDYFQSILDAYSVDGKLYCIPNSFYVSTTMGKASDVGNTPGWTLDDLMMLIASKPEGTEVFDYATKDYILQTCLMFNFDNFIDWETGKCNLDGEEFVKVLEFANIFESEYQYDEERESTPSKIQNGKLLLLSTSFSSVQDYQMYEAMFGEPFTMIGYPCTSGSGNAISGQTNYAINAKSGNKDAAWEFLRSFITPEYYEKGRVWGFPTLISAYDEQNKEYMTPDYYEDENGEQIEQSKGGWGWDDFHVDIYAATQEQVDAVTELINSCDRVYSYDNSLLDIILEEASPFFEGQKSAQEAADIIQSRVQIYVNENR